LTEDREQAVSAQFVTLFLGTKPDWTRMSDTRQGTLRDYMRVLRSGRTAIIAVTLLCAGIAAGMSLSQETKYIAAARVTFQEENRSNAEAGLATLSTQSAAQLAAEGASTMLSNDVLARVRRRLRSDRTITQLRAMLATSVDPSSTLVTVQATATDKTFAAALANAVMEATGNLSALNVVGQIRLTAVDLMRASGMERDRAQQAVRTARLSDQDDSQLSL